LRENPLLFLNLAGSRFASHFPVLLKSSPQLLGLLPKSPFANVPYRDLGDRSSLLDPTRLANMTVKKDHVIGAAV
jgi:hypothetical protein